jgi:hypothetical protein
MEVPEDTNSGAENNHEQKKSPTWSTKTGVELFLVILTVVNTIAQLVSHWV